MKSLSAAALLFAFTALGFGQSTNSDTALGTLRKELETNPKNSLAHYRIGEILFQRQDYQAAANEFREALTGNIQPKWIEAVSRIYLGKIFDATGQSERAANEYRMAKLVLRMQLRTANDLPLPAGAYRVGNGVVGPRVIEKQEPEYSEEARLAGLEGTVLLTGVVAEDGLMRDIRVTMPLGLGLDESAVEAVKLWRFTPGTLQEKPVPVFTTVSVDFVLPNKQSRWHLIRAAFHPGEGVSRPIFWKVAYPPGAGISRDSIDHGQIIAAVGRQGTVTVSFDIDEQGYPDHFRVENASDKIWGGEAISLIKDWQFLPGAKDGKRVPVPCTLTLVWGQRNVDASRLTQLHDMTDPQQRPFNDQWPPTPAPVLIQKTEPSYSEEALKAKVEGTVVLSVVIGEDGVPKNLSVVRPLGFGLDERATEAVSKWRFRPSTQNGQPASFPANIEVNFQLPKDSAPAVPRPQP